MMNLLVRFLRWWLVKWEYSVAARYRRAMLILDCRVHGVELALGNDVHFHHSVRVWGVGGKLVIEDGVWFGYFGGNRYLNPISLQLRSPGAELRIGRGVWIMPATQILCFERVTIGAGAMFGLRCLLIDSDVHDFTPQSGDRPGRNAPVAIGEGARICPETTILKGVKIGDHAVVGNKSVVQCSLPARCVAAGNPARVLLRYQEAEPAAPKEKALA